MAKSYLVALCLSAAIFQKKGDLKKIYHYGKNAYYNALISWADLSALSVMPDVELKVLTDTQVKRLSKELIVDASDVTEQVIEDVPRGAHAHSLFAIADAGEPVVRPVLDKLPPVHCKYPGLEDVKVYFDAFSHQSGKLRCFTECRKHDKCRLYVFGEHHASKEAAVAYLIAWASLRDEHPNWLQGADHVRHKPDAELVDCMLREQFM